MGHFISLKYFSSQEIDDFLDLTKAVKAKPGQFKSSLSGKCIGLLFEKASLRTKTAFYAGAMKLGAKAIYYSPSEVQLGQREEVKDVARTLALYLDLVVLRTYSHETIMEFTRHTSIPVVNGLSDLSHPSQALADVFTIFEAKGDLKKLKVVYVGDGNNVCNSLIYIFSILGGNLTLVIPKKYTPGSEIMNEAKNYSSISGAKIDLVFSLEKAVKDADVLYTDVWTSMGNESQAETRKKAFKSFQINDNILGQAKSDCIVMHCLPAHRGQEITDSVIESKNSVIFSQAQNRLYAAQAILMHMLKYTNNRRPIEQD